ncbi:hypothetical protein PGTUg99_036708 [Puccinia graminis f. sp. tritici]|uniref:Uncharacterized protein n=1 Tax=Puccinia graminis f. sp. tritici TaxID=56615 RepID=A0A5B0NNE6_PUCGR|nr:hypothetical protein PGTUg99_036708 [Puccinia graminis f. sp. tritici]
MLINKFLVFSQLLHYYSVSTHPISSSKNLVRRAEDLLEVSHCKHPQNEEDIKHSYECENTEELHSSKKCEDSKLASDLQGTAKDNGPHSIQALDMNISHKYTPKSNEDLAKFNNIMKERLDKDIFIQSLKNFLKTLTQSEKEVLLKVAQSFHQETPNMINTSEEFEKNEFGSFGKNLDFQNLDMWVSKFVNQSTANIHGRISTSNEKYDNFDCQQKIDILKAGLDNHPENENILKGIKLMELDLKIQNFEKDFNDDFTVDNWDGDEYRLYHNLIQDSISHER